MELRIVRLGCLKCGHEWTPRKREVRVCPWCRSGDIKEVGGGEKV